MVTSKETKIRDLALNYCEKILQFNPNITFSMLFKDSLEARDLYHQRKSINLENVVAENDKKQCTGYVHLKREMVSIIERRVI